MLHDNKRVLNKRLSASLFLFIDHRVLVWHAKRVLSETLSPRMAAENAESPRNAIGRD